MKEVRPADIEGAPIGGRRFHDGTLTLVGEGGDEVHITCTCDRSHWLVTVREGPSGSTLTLVCHNCGSRFEFPYVGSLPMP